MSTPANGSAAPDAPLTDALDLADFHQRLLIRPLGLEDFPAIKALQERCFVGMEPSTKDRFESRVRRFPEGQLGLEYDGQLVAAAGSLIVDFNEYDDWHDWTVVADDGYIQNHDPEGDTLYGIEMMVDPAFRGMKLSRRLYEARKHLARQFNLERIIIGGRIPGYGTHADDLSAQEYIDRVIAKQFFDPVLTAQLANGFVLQRLIPDYLPEDTDSRGYATSLVWNNIDHIPATSPRSHRAFYPVRVGIVQYQMRPVTSFKEFAQQTEYFIDTAADYRLDFVVFPELFTTQLLSIVHENRPALEARRLAEYTPQYLDLLSSLALRYNLNIVGGSTLVVEDDNLYNVAFLFRRDGTVEKQYKIHVTPAEARWWGVQGGSKVQVFDTDRGKVAILICYDIEFPELARIATAKGAQILFVPFNTSDRHGYHRVRLCAQARCIENHVYVAMAGCVGNLPFVENADTHYAQSAILTPSDVPFARDGVAAECTPNIETVIVHELDTQLLRRHRSHGTVRNWNDRRLDLYRIRYDDGMEGIDV